MGGLTSSSAYTKTIFAFLSTTRYTVACTHGTQSVQIPLPWRWTFSWRDELGGEQMALVNASRIAEEGHGVLHAIGGVVPVRVCMSPWRKRVAMDHTDWLLHAQIPQECSASSMLMGVTRGASHLVAAA